MQPRVALTTAMPDQVAERAQKEFGAILSQDRDMTRDDVLQLLRDQPIEGLLVSSRLKVDASLIAQLPERLKIIATCSVGYDHIDVAAAQARGLPVTNTPDVLTDATADLAFMLLLCACRRAKEYGAIMQDGWRRKFGMNQMLGIEVSGRTLGILGMGRIGRAMAQRARGFGMHIIYHNTRRLPPELEQGAHYYSDFREMLKRSEVLTLHAPAGAGTASVMNRETFALLPRGAVLVNSARGQLVDEDALVDALQSGQLAGAGLDVFRSEPDYDLRLRDLPNVFLTPHMGSATVETRNAMGFRALDNIAAVLSGGEPIDPVRRAGT